VTDEPRVVNVTDQRYYYVAAIIPRSESFRLGALMKMIKMHFEVTEARLPRPDPIPSVCRIETFGVLASPSYAGSEDARQAMLVPRRNLCAYDAFALEVSLPENTRAGSLASNTLLVLGTSYAALTRHTVGRICYAGELAQHALFAVPDLQEVLRYCRTTPGGESPTIKFTVTGIGTVRPGGKNVSGLRLSGRNVLADGLLELVESWVRGPSASPAGSAVNATDPGFRVQTLRLRASSRTGIEAATFTLGKDGSLKMWMRAKGASLAPFGCALGEITAKRLVEASSNIPKWADEPEL
jgi:hypothetical protein